MAHTSSMDLEQGLMTFGTGNVDRLERIILPTGCVNVTSSQVSPEECRRTGQRRSHEAPSSALGSPGPSWMSLDSLASILVGSQQHKKVHSPQCHDSLDDITRDLAGMLRRLQETHLHDTACGLGRKEFLYE